MNAGSIIETRAVCGKCKHEFTILRTTQYLHTLMRSLHRAQKRGDRRLTERTRGLIADEALAHGLLDEQAVREALAE